LEGIDGSGKSTQARRLASRLRAMGMPVTETREPGGTSIGEGIREILLDRENAPMLPFSELLLFLVCRAQLTAELIRPALQRRDAVISSRYRMSSVAFQGYGRGLDRALIERLNETATGGLQPDLIFLLDVPVDIAWARRGRDPDRIEQEDRAFHERVRQGYLELAARLPAAVTVDGTGSPDAVADAIAAHLLDGSIA
jgi:dTMP kinase